MRTLARRAAAATLMATLVLGGCSGGSGSDDGSDTLAAFAPTGEPASGITVSGDGYTYVAPMGWAEPDEKPAGYGLDTVASDTNDTDGFTDNINVVTETFTPPVAIDKYGDQLVTQLRAADIENVAIAGTGTIDGESAIHISSSVSTNVAEQYYVVHGDTTYIVTLSHSTDVPEDERNELAASILTTWKWTS